MLNLSSLKFSVKSLSLLVLQKERTSKECVVFQAICDY